MSQCYRIYYQENVSSNRRLLPTHQSNASLSRCKLRLLVPMVTSNLLKIIFWYIPGGSSSGESTCSTSLPSLSSSSSSSSPSILPLSSLSSADEAGESNLERGSDKPQTSSTHLPGVTPARSIRGTRDILLGFTRAWRGVVITWGPAKIRFWLAQQFLRVAKL